MKLYKIILFFVVGISTVSAQSVNTPLNSDYQHLVERYEILQGGNYDAYHNVIKPFTRKGVADLADSMRTDSLRLSKVDKFNIDYLQSDNWEWSALNKGDSKKPLLKKFYRKENAFYSVDIEDFNLQVNPVLYLGLGQDNSANGTPYINSRGIELRGMISKKLGFYTFLTDNQMRSPGYVQQRVLATKAVPNEGFWKTYGSTSEYDFFHTRGYISFDPIKNINLQFGHDKFFVGNGYRSLVLSDQSAPYLFLKLNTKVWRINYTNIFAQMKANVIGNNTGLFGGTPFPNKYFAFHHLNVNITKNLSIGAFESIVFGERDTISNNAFDVNYLNPIIFYRSIEQHSGSPDNAFVGLDFRWILFKSFSLYGQFLLDEFLAKELKAGNGWWGNKFAAQGGFKYINVAGIKNLDIQGELNIARPFTYAHDDNFTNYSHYNQPLAHPWGANFREFVGIIRYQPISRLFVVLKGIYAEKGEDSSEKNFGGNIFRDYTKDRNEYGNSIAQGIPNNIIYGDLTLSYMLKHNFWLDLKQTFRINDTDLPGNIKNTSYTFASLRWNIASRNYEF